MSSKTSEYSSKKSGAEGNRACPWAMSLRASHNVRSMSCDFSSNGWNGSPKASKVLRNVS